MEKEALVVAVDKEVVRVRIMRHSSCSKCGACGAGGDTGMEVRLPTKLQLQPGDRVRVSLKTSDFLKGVLIVYLAPLLLFFAGYLIGYKWTAVHGPDGWEEGGGLIFGLLFLILSYMGINRYNRKIAGSQKYRLEISRVIKKNS